jgi:hypothetical protein
MAEKNEKKKLSIQNAIKNNIYILKFIYKLSPFYLNFIIVSRIILNSAYALINVIFVKEIIDGVLDKKDFKDIIDDCCLYGNYLPCFNDLRWYRKYVRRRKNVGTYR